MTHAKTQPKEYPILFSAPMVRAILEDRKTQTRRIVKTQPSYGFNEPYLSNGVLNWRDGDNVLRTQTRCPYGQPGDRLWVRETFDSWRQFDPFTGETIRIKYLYRADGFAEYEDIVDRWTPSIHMPRAACRLLLEITDVRVERLQEISEEDVLAEGFAKICKDGQTWKYGLPDRDGYPGGTGWPWQQWDKNPATAFQALWQSINGPESWSQNPWVWVVEFKRAK